MYPAGIRRVSAGAMSVRWVWRPRPDSRKPQGPFSGQLRAPQLTPRLVFACLFLRRFMKARALRGQSRCQSNPIVSHRISFRIFFQGRGQADPWSLLGTVRDPCARVLPAIFSRSCPIPFRVSLTARGAYTPFQHVRCADVGLCLRAMLCCAAMRNRGRRRRCGWRRRRSRGERSSSLYWRKARCAVVRACCCALLCVHPLCAC